MSNVRREIERTNEVWDRFVVPILSEATGKPTRWVSAEGDPHDELRRLLDRDHLTDGLLVVGRKSYQAAKRVQFAWSATPNFFFKTITVRTSRLDGGRTELDKLPFVGSDHMHLQAYMNYSGTALLGLVMARSHDVLKVLGGDEKPNLKDGTLFRYADWSNLQDRPRARLWTPTAQVAVA